MWLILFLFIFCHSFWSLGFVAYDCTKMIKYSVFGPTTASGMFISSTGECSALRSESANKKSKVFAQKNNEELKEDIAQGKGEYLDTFTSMMECSKVKKSLYPRLQREYVSLINSEGMLIYKQLRRVYSKVCR